jgi:DNA-binding transcriptional LysR family regulator
MQDLNDTVLAKVVEHGGFMAASRMLGIPKSRLSRRVAELEERLGVQPAATHRGAALTEVGGSYYQHCRCAGRGRGRRRGHCPHQRRTAWPGAGELPELLAKTLLAPSLPRFMQRYPRRRALHWKPPTGGWT